MSPKRKSKSSKKRRASDRGTSFVWKVRTSHLLLLTVLVAVAYCLYSLVSDGFYQHDEVAHFLNMRTFWHDPGAVLGNWAKTGYKLLFAPVALLGTTAVLIVNCLVAAFCCYFAYRLAEELGSETPLLAFVFLAPQPFWLQMSFRTVPETLLALVIVCAVLMHYRRKLFYAALLLSYAVVIRQELYPVLVLYGLYLLFRREFIPALTLFLFPACYHLWGWVANDDPAYLLNQLLGHSQRFTHAYPRHGFGHYFRMSLVIFGALPVTFFLVYLGQVLFYKKKVHALPLVIIAVYFLEHSIFNARSITVGPATGGVLRYLIILSPLIAVLAAIGIDRLKEFKNAGDKVKLAYILVPFVMAVYVFMKYRHNNLVFTDETDFIPVVTVIVSVLLVFVSLRRNALVVYVIICSIGFAFLAVRPIKRSSEDTIMLRVVQWARDNRFESGPMLVDHPLFYYYSGKLPHEFANGADKITAEGVEEAAVGTKILWDSHYSFRPEFKETQVDFTYFMERPDTYRLMTEPRYFSDIEFWVLAFEKISE